MRFVAALSVVLAHAVPKIMPVPDYPPLWHLALSQAAGLGMPLFFVLSGFVIQYNYFDAIVRRPGDGLARFFVARFARLYPLYIVCVAFDIAYRYGYSQVSKASIEAIPFYATLTQAWIYKVIGKFNLIFQFGTMSQITWSISTEFFFYIAFPVVCLVLASVRGLRSRLVAWGCLAAIVALALAVVVANLDVINAHAAAFFGPVADADVDKEQSFVTWLLYISPYFELAAFLTGCLVASIYMDLQDRPLSAAERKWGGLATLICAAAVLTVHIALNVATALPSAIGEAVRQTNLIMVPPIAALLFCCARYDGALARFLGSRLMVRGGEISYSMYLLHMLSIDAFRWEAAVISAPRVALADGLRLLATLTCVLGAANLTYHLIEMPGKRFVTNLLLGWRAKSKTVSLAHARSPAAST